MSGRVMMSVRAPRPVAVPRGALAVAALAGLVQRALRVVTARTEAQRALRAAAACTDARRGAPAKGKPHCA